jgi:hypothetical protein
MPYGLGQLLLLLLSIHLLALLLRLGLLWALLLNDVLLLLLLLLGTPALLCWRQAAGLPPP